MSKTVSFNLTPSHHIIESNLNFHHSEMPSNFETPKVPIRKIEADEGKLLKLSSSKYLTFSHSPMKSDELEASLKLYNSNAYPIIFKFKTTSPERYILKPVIGYLNSQQFCQVKFRIPKEYCHENLINNDRFQIIWKACLTPDYIISGMYDELSKHFPESFSGSETGEDVTDVLNQRKFPTSRWNQNASPDDIVKESRLQCRVVKSLEITPESFVKERLANGAFAEKNIVPEPEFPEETEIMENKESVITENQESVITPIVRKSTNWYKIFFFILLPIVAFLIYVIFNIVEED